MKLLYDDCSTALDSNLEKAHKALNSSTFVQYPTIEQKQAALSIERKVRVTEQQQYPIIDSHESAQYYVLELGNKLNFLTYTPDLSKEFDGKKLGEFASTKQLSSAINQQGIRMIDVIWCDEDNFPNLCFEIENTTNFINALVRFNKLRLYDVRFFFVAPKDRRIEFENLIKDLPIKFDKNRLKFISYEDLVVVYETTLHCYNKVNELLGQKITLAH